MGLDVQQWVNVLTGKLKGAFEARLLFVGLQGSHRRGEAKPASDIDIVVILDTLSMEDLKHYKALIAGMSEKEKACGFIAGKDEIRNWPKMDIFQFKNDTMPLVGSLDGLVPEITRQDIEAYVRYSCANFYHMAVHSYLYDKNSDSLAFIVKPLLFLFQAMYYLRTGKYISSKKELAGMLTREEKEMLEMDVGQMSGQELERKYAGMIRYFSDGFVPGNKMR